MQDDVYNLELASQMTPKELAEYAKIHKFHRVDGLSMDDVHSSIQDEISAL